MLLSNSFFILDKDENEDSKRHFVTCGMLKQNFDDFLMNARKHEHVSGSDECNDVAQLDTV